MAERSDPQGDVIGPHPILGRGLLLFDVHRQRSVAEDGRLGRPGGARREGEHGGGIPVELDPVGGFTLDQLLEGGAALRGEPAPDDELDVVEGTFGVGGDQRPGRRAGDQRPSLHRVELLLHGQRRRGRIDRHRHHAGADHRQVADDEVAVVRRDDRHPVAWTQPELGQARPQPPDLTAQYPIGGRSATAQHRYAVVVVPVDNAAQVHSYLPRPG